MNQKRTDNLKKVMQRKGWDLYYGPLYFAMGVFGKPKIAIIMVAGTWELINVMPDRCGCSTIKITKGSLSHCLRTSVPYAIEIKLTQ
jgi:hypothetical protein